MIILLSTGLHDWKIKYLVSRHILCYKYNTFYFESRIYKTINISSIEFSMFYIKITNVYEKLVFDTSSLFKQYT
jgi:hypothetical protein